MQLFRSGFHHDSDTRNNIAMHVNIHVTISIGIVVSVAIASTRVRNHFHTCLRLRAFGNNLIQTTTMPFTTLLKILLLGHGCFLVIFY